jgi:hypothetical protein
MIKLYKRMPTGETRYHEAWTSGRTIVEHWGVVGERGETREHKRGPGLNADAALRAVLATAAADGFAEVDDPRTLIIEYRLESWGEPGDVERRGKIEDRMNELLGWTGLGHCDGGSIGSGSMDLRDSPFAGYSRIYEEGA